ncbi:hypothetical protein HDU98_001642 [Podochytrium sp. JEL0797]|nr:hypothetical protein HDU98_001642 [Podochytrium sp. JEL0797]
MDIPHPNSASPLSSFLSQYILAMSIILLGIMAVFYLIKYVLVYFKVDQKEDPEALPGRLWVSDAEAESGTGPAPGYYSMQQVMSLPRYEREGSGMEGDSGVTRPPEYSV